MPVGEDSFGSAFTSGEAFASTHWSRVLTARDHGSPQSDEALEELCRTYWRPLYAYVRRRGSSPEEAQDLTQAFFEKLLEKDYLNDLTPGKGRFRSFLLASLKHFLANQWDHDHRKKRGGGQVIISFDACTAEEDYALEPVDEVTPETLFERRWALTLLDRVLDRLRSEFEAADRPDLFDRLQPFLRCNQPASYAEVAAASGVTEGALKVAVHRLRKRYGELLRAEVAQTVRDPAEVQDEIRYLIQALGN